MTIMHVTEYNKIQENKNNYIMVFTTGVGSMLDKPRVRGWVVYTDQRARWFSNKQKAEKAV